MIGCGVVVLVLAVVCTGAWGRATAARTAALFESPVPAPTPAGTAAR
jgi:hypothetical protein